MEEKQNLPSPGEETAPEAEINEETAENNETEEEKKSPSPLHSIFEWMELFVYSFVLVLVLMTFLVRHSPVIGSSMYPTLKEKDLLLISDINYTPENGDIIVAQAPGLGYDEPIVKRVIATGGQTVDIDFATWTVYVDGEIIEQYGKAVDDAYQINYIENQVMKAGDITFPLEVPEGYIFVLGDNRNGSLDSRRSEVGLVDERMVVGQVFYRIFPLSTFGSLN